MTTETTITESERAAEFTRHPSYDPGTDSAWIRDCRTVCDALREAIAERARADRAYTVARDGGIDPATRELRAWEAACERVRELRARLDELGGTYTG